MVIEKKKKKRNNQLKGTKEIRNYKSNLLPFFY